MPISLITKDASCIAVSLLLIGCGGGGSGSGAQNPYVSKPISTKTTPVTPTTVITAPVTKLVTPVIITTPVVTPITPVTPQIITLLPITPVTPNIVTPPPITPVTPDIVTPPPIKPVTPKVITADRPLFDAADPIGMKDLRNRGITGKGVKIGIVDTDFLAEHAEFGDRVQMSGDGNGNAHGTHVAEVLGGKTIGVAPEVTMLAVASGAKGNNNGLKTHLDIQTLQIFSLSKAKIVNLSMGTGDITKPTKSQLNLRSFKDMVARGSLFVWATGNSGQKNPSSEAGMPLNDPKLERGWLAVTEANVAGNGFGQAEMPSYANRCGVASNWCLAAPGEMVSEITGKSANGTSFAAPAVSGAAALVKQVHPSMNADLLRQTILSTATDMGESEKYGWGMLNVSKAIKGPALFDKRLALGDNVVSYIFDDQNSDFSNDISGDAGLIKVGPGMLTLSGQNTYQGHSQVTAGTLNITGSTASNVNIDSKSHLRGDNGRVKGSVINSGGMQVVGNGLAIGGNYTSEKATLEKQMGAPLTIGGKATLGAQSKLVMTPKKDEASFGYITAQGTTDVVMRAGGGIEGKFSEVGFKESGGDIVKPAATLFSKSALTKNQNSVELHVSRHDLQVVAEQAFATDTTRINSAKNLEKVLRVADEMVATEQTGGDNAVFLMNAAAMQETDNLSAAADVLDSLSGQIHGSAQALTFQQSQSINRDLSNRLAQLGNNNSDNPSAKTGIWTSVIASSGKLTQHGFASANTTLSGGQFGIDTRLNDDTIIGAALAYSDSTANFDRFGGQSKSQNIGASLYGRYALQAAGVNAYVSGRAGIATVDSNVSRTAIVGSEAINLQAKHTDQVLSAYLETGFDHQLTSSISVTPFAGVSYDRVKRGGFSELGNTFGLSANSQAYQQTAGLLGARGNAKFNWFAGKSNVQMYAAWQHAFNNGNLDFAANYTGVAGTNVSVKGIGMQRNTAWVGIGIATDVSKRWSWHANYDAQFGQTGKLNNVISAGIRMHLD
ncbi:autotransporter serine protease [Glaciimonas sp. PCH181]|uniref:autotransporter serine protease n=1 Tax=Glaciimonas sp. PCH181 TaxID=2133943 RepID=UPI000D46F68A|nr:autotransporter serine protease [Glaciimonas sp. PCH181]PUA18743.1 peptidase S8 [Glaciimonas sp. PCH181]